MTDSAEDPSPTPRVFRVGVTGHRVLDPDFIEGIERSVRTVLEFIRDGAAPSSLRLVSPLAAGADQIVASIALDLGYALHCPFPFSVEAYRRDFDDDPEGLAGFDALREWAAEVAELDGVRGTDEERGAAYEAVGRRVMDTCDVLLAVWDGKPPAGRGGTGQIVEEAAARSHPLIVFPSHLQGAPALVHYSPPGSAPGQSREYVGLRREVIRLVRGLLGRS